MRLHQSCFALITLFALLLFDGAASTAHARSLLDDIVVSANECASSSGTSTLATVSSQDPNVNILIFAENKQDNVFNPERGWIANIHLEVTAERNRLSEYYRSGRRMVLALFNLRDFTYAGARLSGAKLGELTSFLDTLRAMGMKAIFRAAYDFAGVANPEPNDMQDVLAHQDQLAPVIHAYKDVIFHVQAGMFGSWGEMHSSKHVSTPSRVLAMTRKWLDALPATMGVSLRTPAFMKSIIDALRSSNAANDVSRIGFYNDCLFGSASDYATYGSRTADLRWLQDYTRVAVMGGETCPPISGEERWSDPANAIPELLQLHTSYLNRDWYPPVYEGSNQFPRIVGWRNRATCDGAENAYDYVSKRMGYRYVFKSGAMTRNVPAGGVMRLMLKIQNIGFSAIKSCRTIQVAMSSGGTTYKASVKGDPRSWERENGIIELGWYLRLPRNIAPGTWNVYLNIVDCSSDLSVNNPKYNVQFANLGTWQESTGSNQIHTVTVVAADGSSVAGSTLHEIEAPPPTTLVSIASTTASSTTRTTAATIAATTSTTSATTTRTTTSTSTTTSAATAASTSASSTTGATSTSTSATTAATASTTASTASTSVASTSAASTTATTTTGSTPTWPPPSEDPVVSDSPAPSTDSPVDILLAGVDPPLSVATADAPPQLTANNTPVWRALSLSAASSGADLVIGLSSFVSFSLGSNVEIYVFTDNDTDPDVTLKGNNIFVSYKDSPVSTVVPNPPSGLDMSLVLPLSLLPSRTRIVRVSALNTDTAQRIPIDDYILNVTLPVFSAHIRFTTNAVVPPNVLSDTGAAVSTASTASSRSNFTFGWSEDNYPTSPSRCIAFNGRSWALSVLPVSSYYRVRAHLAAPSASTCVGVSMKTSSVNDTLGVACDGSVPVVLEQTVLITGNSLRLGLAANGSASLPMDNNTQICELTVSIATGHVLHHELSVAASDVKVNKTSVINALAALTGEAPNRFTILSLQHRSNETSPLARQQASSARVHITYLIADEWLTSSSVPTSVVSSTLLSASVDQWLSVSPYTPVSSAVVSESGPVPVTYVPAANPSEAPSSKTSPSSGSRKAVIIGVVITVVVVVVILAVVAVYVLYPVPIWRRESGWTITVPSGSSTDVSSPNVSSHDVSSPVTSTTALAP